MRRSVRLLLIVCVSGFLGVCLYLRQPDHSGDLRLEQPIIDVGTLPMGRENTFAVVVCNRGDQVLRIVGVDNELC
jgi:hypothetical protein